MHVLFISNYWPPEIGAHSHLGFELGETVVRRGHRLTVITGFPRYNVVSPTAKYHGKWMYEEEMAGMRVLRIAVPDTGGAARVKRGLAQLALVPMYALRGFGVRDVDVVYTVTPPLPLALSAWAVARQCNAGFCLGVQDLFPQSAIDLGVLRNRALIRFFEGMERFSYRSADAVTVHSEGNREHVIAKGGIPARTHVVPNWVDTEFIQPAERMNVFRQTAGLNGEFVVLFAGTMGWSQGVGVAVEAARYLASEPGLKFLLVGDGVDRPSLEASAKGLPNVLFLPMQPKELYPSILAAADACLVTLRPEVATPVVPSKLLTIMAAERPVLSSMPVDGDAPRIVTESGGGIVCRPGDARSLADAVLYLERNRAAALEMARKGRRFVEAHFSRLECVRQFERLFAEISRRRA